MASNGKTPQGELPVVGITALAGGSKTIARLLETLPADTGIAIVLQQRAGAAREETVADRLAKSAKIPVCPAANEMPVAPDRVYVLPPKTTSTVKRGVLKLAPEAPAGPRERRVTEESAVPDLRGRSRREFREMPDHTGETEEIRRAIDERVAERTAEFQNRIEQLKQIALALVDTERRERQRLAGILHDDLQQLLVGAQMQSVVAFKPHASPEMREFAQELIEKAIEATHSLAREIAPPVITDGGLRAALHWLSRWAGERYKMDVEIEMEEDAEPDDKQVRVFLFQEIRELLTNVARHAGTDRVRVSLSRAEGDDSLQVRVEDVGQGLAAARSTAGELPGLELAALEERLALLDGRIEIKSAAGRGTVIQFIVPLERITG